MTPLDPLDVIEWHRGPRHVSRPRYRLLAGIAFVVGLLVLRAWL